MVRLWFKLVDCVYYRVAFQCFLLVMRLFSHVTCTLCLSHICQSLLVLFLTVFNVSIFTWTFLVCLSSACTAMLVRSLGQPRRGASRVTVMKQIVRTNILVTERRTPVRTLKAKQWSQVMNSGLLTESVTRYGKTPFGELISNWPATALADLGLLLAQSGCDSMHGASSESWRAPVLVAGQESVLEASPGRDGTSRHSAQSIFSKTAEPGLCLCCLGWIGTCCIPSWYSPHCGQPEVIHKRVDMCSSKLCRATKPLHSDCDDSAKTPSGGAHTLSRQPCGLRQKPLWNSKIRTKPTNAAC